MPEVRTRAFDKGEMAFQTVEKDEDAGAVVLVCGQCYQRLGE